MGQLVQPSTYRVGFSELDEPEVLRFLRDTGNEDFWQSVLAAKAGGVSTAEILCSMMAKLCYDSLTLGKNANVTRIRDIPDNIRGCFDQGHGTVFEHVGLNFVTRNCSRVFTHELVRHRVGTSYSQQSGRYVRLDSIDLVFDPILEPVRDLFEAHATATEELVYLAECRLGLRKPNPANPQPAENWVSTYNDEVKWVPDNSFDFALRKKLTSAIRRVAPNGQANTIGYTINLRALRHFVMARTAPAAEWEIRLVAGQVYDLAKEKWPLMFHGAREKVVDGLRAVDGMKLQPYEVSTAYLGED